MAKDKKELDDDLLTGGKTLSSDADNKKAEKKKQAAAKKAEKNAAKLAAKKEKLLKEIEAAKAAVAAESDTEKKEKEQTFDWSSYGIGERELEITALVAEGLSNKEISEKVCLSEGTVRNYISNVLEKLELRDRTQLAVYYLQRGRKCDKNK
mgnify:CR=1 FL=1